VALQQDAGLDVVTDGEMRRYAFFGHLVEALEGFDKFGGWSITFRDGQGHDDMVRRPVVVDKLRWRPSDERRGVYVSPRPNDSTRQGDASQRAAGIGLLRSGQVTGRLRGRATRISRISWTSLDARSRN